MSTSDRTPPVTAVIFDFYGTLAEAPDWGPSWGEVLAEAGHDLPDDVRDRWWSDGLDGTEHDEHSRSRDHYVAWQEARLRGMLDECGVPTADHDDLMARVQEIGGNRRITAYAESAAVVASLRERGITVAICSNWDWDLLEAIEAAGLTGCADITVSSAWVGARKPHRRIYDHTLGLLDIDPAGVLFVGDTWTCDVEGPLGAGMRPVYVRREHFGPDHTAPADHHERPGVHRVADLRPVAERLS